MSRKKICIINTTEAEVIANGNNLSCKHHRHMSQAAAVKLTESNEARHWLKDASFKASARWAVMPNGKQSNRYLVIMQDLEWRQINSSGFSAMQLVPKGGRGRTNGNRYKIKLKDRHTIQCKSEVNGKPFREWKKELEKDAQNTNDPQIVQKAPNEVWRHLWITGAPPSFNPA